MIAPPLIAERLGEGIMTPLRFILSAVAMLTLSGVAFAQSDAQKSLDKLKTLAGTWEGRVTTNPPQAEMGDGALTQISLRVTSRGNALVHEMKAVGTPDDPTRYDHPVTMLYLGNDRLLLTHYCDAGNRPRMVARISPDGNTVEFDFLDVAGGMQYGHIAPCGLYRDRCEPSHRGLDVHHAWRQTGQCPLRLDTYKMNEGYLS
jgi:hypothetical protein